jgi:hypothetical protein
MVAALRATLPTSQVALLRRSLACDERSARRSRDLRVCVAALDAAAPATETEHHETKFWTVSETGVAPPQPPVPLLLLVPELSLLLLEPEQPTANPIVTAMAAKIIRLFMGTNLSRTEQQDPCPRRARTLVAELPRRYADKTHSFTISAAETVSPGPNARLTMGVVGGTSAASRSRIQMCGMVAEDMFP